MKKHVLTLAAVSVMAANAAVADVTVYGKANVSLQSITVDEGNVTTQDNWELLSNASRLGFKGSDELSEGLEAVYQLEYETALDDGTVKSKSTAAVVTDVDFVGETVTTKKVLTASDLTLKQRNSFVGVKGGFGTLIAGIHDSPTKMLGGSVDIFSDYEYADIKNVVVGENRVSNMIMYKSNDLSGFKINVMIAPGEDNGGDNAGDNEKDGIADHTSMSVNYSANGLSVGVAVDSDIAELDSTRLVVAYDQKDWGVSALYQTAEENSDYLSAGDDAAEQTGMILTAFYKVGDWKLKALVGDSTVEDDDAEDLDISQAVIGADYKLGKKTKAFVYHASVKTEQKGEDDIDESTFGIGLEHKF